MDGQSELNHGKRIIPAVQTSYESKGLQQHIEYQFWVTATTRVGEGPSSKVVSQLPSSRGESNLLLSFWESVKVPVHLPNVLEQCSIGISAPSPFSENRVEN